MTLKIRLKQESIKNVVMNYKEIKAGPGGHLEFLNCIALKINLQIDSHDIEAAPEAATATADWDRGGVLGAVGVKGYWSKGVWGSVYLYWDGLEFLKDDVVMVWIS